MTSIISTAQMTRNTQTFVNDYSGDILTLVSFQLEDGKIDITIYINGFLVKNTVTDTILEIDDIMKLLNISF